MDRPDSPSLIEFEKRQKRGAGRLVLGGLAALTLDAVEQQRAPDGSVRPEAKAALVALGPQVCMSIVVRLGRPDPVARAALQSVLVQHAGRDFGATSEAWMPWCTMVVQSAHGIR